MQLLFDFDGTIADSLPLTTQVLFELSTKYHLKLLTQAELVEARDSTIKELFAKSGLNLFQLPFFIRDSQKIIANKIHLIKPFPNLAVVLQQLSMAGHKFGIVTSNSTENVMAFLENNQLTDLFEFVHSEKNIWGKAAAFKNVISKHKLSKNEVVYLGDESRDIEASHKAGLKIISVSWGFNSAKLLKTFQPDFLIDKPEELLDIIRQLS